MISLVSGPPADIDASSLRPNSAHRAPQAGAAPQGEPGKPVQLPDAPQSATRITLSQMAQDFLRRADNPTAPPSVEMPAGALGPGQAEKLMQVSQIEMQLKQLDWLEDHRQGNTESLKDLQASYEKVRDTPPKAAVLLNAEETQAALKMLSDAGRTPGGESYGFLDGNFQYNFKQDGTVTRQEQGVATSRQSQKELLALYEERMSFVSDMLKDTSVQRQDLTAQRDALLA